MQKTMICHLVPVLGLSFIFNITKFISISPIGPDLQKIPEYLKFILFFQAFHPLTTTGLAPLCILVFLNYKVNSPNSLTSLNYLASFVLVRPSGFSNRKMDLENYIIQNYFIADIRSNERSQKVLQTRKQENQGIRASKDHDGPGPRLSHPQHAASNSRSYRSK